MIVNSTDEIKPFFDVDGVPDGIVNKIKSGSIHLVLGAILDRSYNDENLLHQVSILENRGIVVTLTNTKCPADRGIYVYDLQKFDSRFIEADKLNQFVAIIVDAEDFLIRRLVIISSSTETLTLQALSFAGSTAGPTGKPDYCKYEKYKDLPQCKD